MRRSFPHISESSPTKRGRRCGLEGREKGRQIDRHERATMCCNRMFASVQDFFLYCPRELDVKDFFAAEKRDEKGKFVRKESDCRRDHLQPGFFLIFGDEEYNHHKDEEPRWTENV